MKNVVNKYLGIAALASVCLLVHTAGQAYQADDASTPTLWKIANPVERVAADKKRRGDYYANRIKLFLEENATSVTEGGIVFVGDSITNRFPIDEAFKGQAVYNRGIGGDRIEGVLERLDCSVIKLKPREIRVMIGTNDVLWPADYHNGNLAPGYVRLFNALKDVAPQAKIVAYKVLPIDKHQDRLGTCIKDAQTANEQLTKVCKDMGIELVDTYSLFATPEGNFKPGLSSDGVHLTLAGYMAWLDLILKTPEEKVTVWKNLSPLWKKTGSDECKVTTVNGYRALDTLILFRKNKGTTITSTGTNEWGLEAMVENDTVTSMSRKGNMTLPKPPGYILSGIGVQQEWMTASLSQGTKVKLSEDGTSVRVVKPAPKNSVERYMALRGRLLELMSSAKGEQLDYLKKVGKRIVLLKSDEVSAKEYAELNGELTLK